MKKKNKREFYKRKDWNKRLIAYKKKIEAGKFTVQDVPSFIEDYFNADYQLSSEETQKLMELKNSLEKIRTILAKYYKCKEDELCLGDYKYRYPSEEVNYKVIFGDANFYDVPKDVDIGNLQIIEGNASFVKSRIESLCNIRSIRGNLYCACSYIKSLGELQNVGGDVSIFSTPQLETLGNLRKVGGRLSIESPICDLGKLYSAGSISAAYCCGKEIDNLSELRRMLPEKAEWNNRLKKYIEKIDNAEFTTEDVPKLVKDYFKIDYYTRGSNNLNFRYLENHLIDIRPALAKYYKCKESEVCLGSLYTFDQLVHHYKVVFGNAKFREIPYGATRLKGIHTVLGDTLVEGKQITDLGDLRNVGGNIVFYNSRVHSIGKLENLGGEIIGNEYLKKQFETRRKRKQKLDRFNSKDIAMLTRKQESTRGEVNNNALVKVLNRMLGQKDTER